MFLTKKKGRIKNKPRIITNIRIMFTIWGGRWGWEENKNQGGYKRRNGNVIYGGYFRNRLELVSVIGSKAQEAKSFGLMTLDY